MKPDLFVGSRWAYSAVFGKFDENDTRPCGKVMDSRLYDTIYILDCKCTCTPEAFGELIIHLQYLNTTKTEKVSRGMLFGKTEFWLAVVQGTQLIERTVGRWDQNGAGDRIASFFPGLAWDDVEKICRELNCKVVEPTEECPTAFLGAGTNGRVLRVSKEGNKYALKVALAGEKSHLLHREYAQLKEHQGDCSDAACACVVRHVQQSLVSLDPKRPWKKIRHTYFERHINCELHWTSNFWNFGIKIIIDFW